MDTKSTSLILAIATIASTIVPAFAAKTEAPANKPAKTETKTEAPAKPAKSAVSKKKVSKKKAAPSSVPTENKAK